MARKGENMFTLSNCEEKVKINFLRVLKPILLNKELSFINVKYQ